MNAEIIAIGSELLLGQIVDTNSSYIARRFAENGIDLHRTTAIGDDLQKIRETIREAINRSQIVITTGGIGPTEDDLTREAVAEVFERPLAFQPHLMVQIETLFKKRGFKMAESNRKQAYIPKDAIPIENPKGTAPGFIVETSNGAVISIPGVPLEMEYLLDHTVIPYLRGRFQMKQEVIQYRVLRVCGVGESSVGQQIKDLMKNSKNPIIGTLASMGDIKIRITAKANNPKEASTLIQRMEQEIRNRLGPLIYGVDEETLQGNIVRELERLNLTLSLIETFTGGTVSQRLISTGSPSIIQAEILPSEISQRHFLNLSEEEFTSLTRNLKTFSELLAQKARNNLQTNLGLALIGKVVDTSGKDEFRMETYYSLSTSSGKESLEYPIGGESWTLRERASIIALDLLRKYLLRLNQRDPK